MRNLISQILAGIIGIWLATQYVSGVEFEGPIQILLVCGLILGLVNFFIKPIINLLTLPLRILSLGLLSLIINMGIVWIVVDLLFPKHLEIVGIKPLFLTTLIVWALSIIFSFFTKGASK